MKIRSHLFLIALGPLLCGCGLEAKGRGCSESVAGEIQMTLLPACCVLLDGPWGQGPAESQAQPLAPAKSKADTVPLEVTVEGRLWYYQTTEAIRPNSPGFRALCALIQSRLGKWQRLVLLERMFLRGMNSLDYGFIVVAVQPPGITCFTNLRWTCDKGGWHLEAAPSPFALCIEDRKFAACLADLERAKQHLGKVLLWQDACDWPIFVLHDIASDGKSFAFAMFGFDAYVPSTGGGLERSVDYAQAGNLQAQLGEVVVARKQGKEFRFVADCYATLLARVWDACLGAQREGPVRPSPVAVSQ